LYCGEENSFPVLHWAKLFSTGNAVGLQTEIQDWRMGRMGFDQIPQLATDPAVEFQIGPQFDPHGNIPMFRTDGDQAIQLRLEIHHFFVPFPALYPSIR
jgi:hypothetical protein